jgi:hypothetical protein
MANLGFGRAAGRACRVARAFFGVGDFRALATRRGFATFARRFALTTFLAALRTGFFEDLREGLRARVDRLAAALRRAGRFFRAERRIFFERAMCVLQGAVG